MAIGSGRIVTLCSVWIFGLFVSFTSSFELEGSQSSYAKFPRWRPCQNGSISFEFLTSEPSGLLLYFDDGGRYDFLEVKIVTGTARLRLNFGGGTITMTIGQNLADRNWHKLEIHRNGEETTLVVDSVAQTKPSAGSEFAFGNVSTNSNVFIGGMPTVYTKKLSSMALPSVVFEPRFKGSVRNLLYSQCAGPVERVEMLDYEGVRTTDWDACEEANPCHHDGMCISTDVGAMCDCSRTDYTGQFCEEEKVPSEATFLGTEFLSYDLSMRGDPIVSSNDEVSLFFKTRQSSGMLFYTGDGGDFVSVALRDGIVVVSINLGSGVVETSVRPEAGSVKLDDNRWHRLTVSRESRELTVELDDSIRRSGTAVGDFTMLSSKKLYVGGSANSATLPGAIVQENFRGCLRKVIYKADSIDLDILDLARNRHDLINIHGDVQFDKCIDLANSQPITFTTRESFIQVSQWKPGKKVDIRFQFRTNEPNGLLMYGLGEKATADFLAIEILDGFLYLLLNLGKKTVKVKAIPGKVNNGVPHKVVLIHEITEGTITVDGRVKTYGDLGKDAELQLENLLSVGGVNIDDDARPLPIQIWSGMLRYGYVGCLQDLTLDGQLIDLVELAQQQDTDGVNSYCRQTERPYCVSRPCLHRGECHEGWNRFVCDCSETAFTGLTCSEERQMEMSYGTMV